MGDKKPDKEKKAKVTIDNGKIVSTPKWGKIDHATQSGKIVGNGSAMNEMFAIHGDDPGEKSGFKLEHHFINSDNEMVVHEGGLLAAEEALLGSRGGTNASSEEKKAAARHLLKHMRAHDIKPADGLEDLAKSIGPEDGDDDGTSVKTKAESDGNQDDDDEHDGNEEPDAEKKSKKKPKKEKDDMEEEDCEKDRSGEDDDETPEERDDRDPKKPQKSSKKKKPKKDEGGELESAADDDEDGEDNDQSGDGDDDKSKKKDKPADDGDEEDADGDEGKNKKKPKGKKSVTKGFVKMEDAYFADASSIGSLLKQAGFPHKFDADTDTFTIHYGCTVVGAEYMPSDAGLRVKDIFGQKAGNAPEFRPTEDELKIINGGSYANKPYQAHDLKVFYTYAADTKVDRHFEHFDKAALKDMADMAPGSPMLMDHNYYNSDGVFGKIFDAKVVQGKSASRLVTKFYMMDKPKFADIIDGFESGINNKLSVGIRMDRKNYICDICKEPMVQKTGDGMYDYKWCGHMPGMEGKDGSPVTMTIKRVKDFLEKSRVTVPAQPAAAVKNVSMTEAAAKMAESIGVSKALQNVIQSALIETENQENSERPKISPDDQSGESTVDETQKEQGQQDAAELISKLVGTFESTMQNMLKATAESLGLVLQAQNESAKQIEAGLATLISLQEKALEQKSVDDEKLAKWKEVVELSAENNRKTLEVALLAHKDIAAKCGIMVGRSVQEVGKQVSASVLMTQTRNEAEASKKVGTDEYYKDLAAQFRG